MHTNKNHAKPGITAVNCESSLLFLYLNSNVILTIFPLNVKETALRKFVINHVANARCPPQKNAFVSVAISLHLH